MPDDKTKGIIRMLASGVFLLFAFMKFGGQPPGEVLYTSRVTIGLYLLISFLLASSSIYLYVKNARKNNSENYYK